jgi:uncharacterized protein (TIGR03437 family)
VRKATQTPYRGDLNAPYPAVSAKTLLPLLCCGFAWGQTAANKGLILQPSGDTTLTNIIVAAAVTPGGAFGYTAEVYLVKTDGSAPPAKLTNFDESNQAPGATSVAISPDGTRAAYIGRLDTNGIRNEEVHSIDIASGTDRLIATNRNTCALSSCFGPIAFSQDGSKLLWGSATSSPTTNTIYTSNFDGSAVTQLSLQQAQISGSNNVTTSTGRFVFTSQACGSFCEQAETANLDGSGATVLHTSPYTVYPGGGLFGDEVISASGNVTAEWDQSHSPSGQSQFFSASVTPGTCTPPPLPNAALGSMTISNDGSHVAYVQSGRILNCESPVTPLSVLYAFDVQLSGDGTRMIYSVGASGVARAAVWIADAGGANERPVFAPRSINASGIVGIGSYPSDILPMSPGSYFTIYGANFVDVDALATPANLPFPLSLAGVSVQVNGTGVPVEAVTPWQINALLPQEMAPGSVTVTVQLPDGTLLGQAAAVTRTAAAIDLIIGAIGDSTLYAAAFHPGTAILADVNHPAAAGEILETYGFGLGPTTPGVAAGAGAPSNPPASAAMPFVNVDGVLAQTTFAGLVPGLVGLYQVNVVVPAGLAPGVHHTHWYTTDPAAGSQGVIYTH